jgi:hypothetical protein
VGSGGPSIKRTKIQEKGTILSVSFKEPLVIDYDLPTEVIMAQIMDAIGQSKKHMMMGRHHWETIDK